LRRRTLAERRPQTRWSDACRKALTAGDPSYRTIKGILTLGIEDDAQVRATGDADAAAFLHGPEQLFGADPAAEHRQAADDTLSMRAVDAVLTMPSGDALPAMVTKAAR
jgi:hypothetical protein